MKRRIIAFLISAVLITTFVFPVPIFANNLDYIPAVGQEIFNILVEENGLEFARNYDRTMQTLSIFFDSIPIDEVGDMVHPPNSGGIYIDDDGNLNILVVGNANSISAFDSISAVDAISNTFNFESFSSHVQRVGGVNVREVEFTHDALWHTQNLMLDLIFGNKGILPAADNVSAWYIDVINNRIVVELIELTPEMIDLFRRTIYDSPMLEFAESVSVSAYDDWDNLEFESEFQDQQLDLSQYEMDNNVNQLRSIQVQVGEALYVRRIPGMPATHSGSVGYPAISSRGSRNGFVTAAHIRSGGLQEGDVVYVARPISPQRIGVIAFQTDVRLNNVDGAFVQLDSNVSVDTNIDWRGPILNNLVTPVVGMRLFSRGHAAPKREHPNPVIREGTIASITANATFIIDGATVTVGGATLARFSSLDGQSGGIAYGPNLPVPGVPESTFGVIGIAVARRGDSETIISRASNINGWLGTRLP